MGTQLIITAQNADDLRAKIIDLIKMFGAAPEQPIAEIAPIISEPAPEPTKKTKKAKAPDAPKQSANLIEAPSSDLDDLFTTSAPEEKATLTTDDVRAALKTFHEKHGADKTKALLREFGCARPADLKPSDFETVVILCSK